MFLSRIFLSSVPSVIRVIRLIRGFVFCCPAIRGHQSCYGLDAGHDRLMLELGLAQKLHDFFGDLGLHNRFNSDSVLTGSTHPGVNTPGSPSSIATRLSI